MGLACRRSGIGLGVGRATTAREAEAGMVRLRLRSPRRPVVAKRAGEVKVADERAWAWARVGGGCEGQRQGPEQ